MQILQVLEGSWVPEGVGGFSGDSLGLLDQEFLAVPYSLRGSDLSPGKETFFIVRGYSAYTPLLSHLYGLEPPPSRASTTYHMVFRCILIYLLNLSH